MTAANNVCFVKEDTGFVATFFSNYAEAKNLPELNYELIVDEMIKDLKEKLPNYNKVLTNCPSFNIDEICKPFAKVVEKPKEKPKQANAADDILRLFYDSVSRKRPRETTETDGTSMEDLSISQNPKKTQKTSTTPIPPATAASTTATATTVPTTTQPTAETPKTSQPATAATVTRPSPPPPATAPPATVAAKKVTAVPPTTAAPKVTAPPQPPAPVVDATPQIVPPLSASASLVPLSDACLYNTLPVFTDKQNGKITQLIPGFQGTCLVGIREKDEVFFVYWNPISYDTTSSNVLQVIRIADTISHPYVAITTTDSYFMLYGSNQEGTLVKVARTGNQSVRNKNPKEIDVKVVLKDVYAPDAKPKSVIFCPSDNNYVVAGFDSGNIGVGRVSNENFQPYPLYKANTVDPITCIDGIASSEILLVAHISESGAVGLLTCHVRKKLSACDIEVVSNVSILEAVGKDPTSPPPMVKFHPSGKIFYIKRKKSLYLYSVENKKVYPPQEISSNALLASFSSCGNRLVVVEPTLIVSFKIENFMPVPEFAFLTNPLSNLGQISSITVNPNRKDNTDFVMGTDRGCLFSLRLTK